MNTLLLSALCLLGAWAALAGEVTVKVSSLSLLWPSWLSMSRAQGLSPDRPPRWGWSGGYV